MVGTSRSHNDYCQPTCTSCSTTSSRDTKMNWISRRAIKWVNPQMQFMAFQEVNYIFFALNRSTQIGYGHRQVRPRLVEGQMSRENRLLPVKILCKAGGRREASPGDAQSSSVGWRARRDDTVKGSNCHSGKKGCLVVDAFSPQQLHWRKLKQRQVASKALKSRTLRNIISFNSLFNGELNFLSPASLLLYKRLCRVESMQRSGIKI